MDGTIALGAYTITADSANKAALITLIAAIFGLLATIAGSLAYIVYWLNT